MTNSLIIGCIWVLLATVTAFLSMRRQFFPGVTLLIAAPILIIWIGYDYGWIVGLISAAAFASMFRNPLRYFLARARGQNPEVPKQ